MPFSAEARQYADLLFEDQKGTLKREHDEAARKLASGLTNKADILAHVGLHNFVQPELSYLEAIARSRAHCLEVAHGSFEGTLTQQIIDEIMVDTGFQIESLSVGLLGNVQQDAELLAKRTGTATTTASISAIGNELMHCRADVMADVERGLKLKLYERQFEDQKAKASGNARRTVKIQEAYALHPEIERVSGALAAEGNWRQAVSEAYIHLIDAVKTKSRLPFDGDKLMNEAFACDKRTPVVQFNPLSDDAERDEQRGIWYLFRGIVGLRNFKLHKVTQFNDPQRGHEYLALTSLLMRLLDSAQVNPIQPTPPTPPSVSVSI